MCERAGKMETESIIFNNLISYGYSVSLNEPITCHCVREFKEYLMNVGLCSSRYIKRTQSLPIKSLLYGLPPHS